MEGDGGTTERSTWPRACVAIGLVLGVIWTLFINGAVPGFGTPTIGQAASMLGYAQAYADQHWYAIHARSFGFPVPASLATGLPLAWLAGWFLRAGMGGADAYAAAMACWLLAGFLGARQLARSWGARTCIATLAAATWMSMPVVWGHQGYSSLALGMAMLPLYFWATSRLFARSEVADSRRRLSVASTFIALCVIALFMDGYTFMMLAIAASWIFVFVFFRTHGDRRGLISVAALYVVGFGGAYALYAWFIGRSAFDPAPLDFFRGWAVDLTFLAKPTAGELWLWDLLGWARERSQTEFYGDASVWTTTFVLPLAVLGVGCFFSLARREWRAWLLLVIASFGLYMALGPTLKFHSTKPPGVADLTMPASAGVLPTGNALLTEHVPGFRSMRAAYRWEALFFLGMWGIVTLRASRPQKPRQWVWATAYVAIIVASTPNPMIQWQDYRTFRRDFGRIDLDVAKPMSSFLAPNSRIFFVPFTNDILANYLAPKIHIVTYNVSGDKQLDISRARWPERISAFAMGQFGASDAPRVRAALLEGDADAVVVPFFDGLNAAHVWPCAAESRGYSAYKLSLVKPIDNFFCPAQIRTLYAPAIAALRSDPLLEVDEEPLFAIVRLRPEYEGARGYARAQARLVEGVNYPLDVVIDPDSAERVLRRGWYGREAATRWSTARAGMTIPIPTTCRKAGCVVHITLAAFAASARRPVTVSLSVTDETNGRGSGFVHESLTDEATHVLSLPLPMGRDVVSLALDVPEAASPAMLGMSPDSRVLGVALSRIDVSSH